MSEPASIAVKAEISEATLNTLKKLAEERGVSANTVLQQAIVNEGFIDQAIKEGSKVLLEKSDRSIVKLDFNRAR